MVLRRQAVACGGRWGLGTAVSIQYAPHTLLPVERSLGGLAVVADIIADHDGAAEAFGSMT